MDFGSKIAIVAALRVVGYLVLHCPTQNDEWQAITTAVAAGHCGRSETRSAVPGQVRLNTHLLGTLLGLSKSLTKVNANKSFTAPISWSL